MAAEKTEVAPCFGKDINLIKKDFHLKLPGIKNASYKNDPSVMYSPVTDLAMNLNDLTTKSFAGDTPKRKLSLDDSDNDTPNFAFKPIALHKRLDHDLCTSMDSPSNEMFAKKRSPLEMKSAAYRRFQAMPSPFFGMTPTPPRGSITSDIRLLSDDNHDLSETPEKETQSPQLRKVRSGRNPLFVDEGSQDSGLGLEKENDFKAPLAPAPRRSRVLSDETNSPAKYSPVKPQRPVSSPASIFQFSSSLLSPSPTKLRHSSITSTDDDGEDDGFLDIIEGSDFSNSSTPLSGLENLFKAPVLNSERKENDQENERPSSRRGLFRSPSLPSSTSRLAKTQSFDHQRRPSYKRSEPCRDDDTPVQYKRARNVRDRGTPEKIAPRLQRCHSETEAIIKTALSRTDDNLIGDFTKPYCLPTVPGKKQDLKSITPDTLADVLNNKYDNVIDRFVIVDARYPYEFESGHIKGAMNYYTKDDIYNSFLESEQYKKTSSFKRNIVIFHCEFSSERGPKMSRFLRNKDRDSNQDVYPQLNYPEVYLLDGGYKEFFAQHKELCTPQEYKPMLHDDHAEDLKHFRAKSKSWAGNDKAKKGSRSIFRSSFRSGLKL